MPPGDIILLNGTSSSGKTSIATALQARLPAPFLHTGTDHFLPRLPASAFVPSDGRAPASAAGFLLVFAGGLPQTTTTAEGATAYVGGTLTEVRIGPTGLRLLRGMYQAIAAYAAAGNGAIADCVIYDPRELRAAVAALVGLPVLLVGVSCPLSVALERERQRGDRAPGGAAAFSPHVHTLVEAHGGYDLVVDTARHTAAECAAQIVAALASDQPRTALDRLARGLNVPAGA